MATFITPTHGAVESVLGGRAGRNCILAGFTAVAAIIAATTSEIHDDPWILYRYAENLANGQGWVFNPGVQSDNAVTSPLAVLALTLGILLRIPVELVSAGMFVAGTWTSAAATFLMFRHTGRAVAGIASGLLLLLAPPLISLQGMETALYLGLVAAAMLALAAERWFILGLLLGLAILARPDAVVIAAVIVAWVVYRSRNLPWRILYGSAAALLPWLMVSIPLTGGLLPSTLAATIAQQRSGEWSGHLVGLLMTPLQPGMWLWFALSLPLGLVGAIVAVRQRVSIVAPLAMAAVGLVLAYGLILNVAAYAWYVALPVFLLAWLAGLGTERIILAGGRRWVLVVVTTSLGAVAISSATLTPRMDPFRDQYQQVGSWLRVEAAPEATVAAAEIGRLGFYSDRTMVDYLGLLDAEAVSHVERADWSWWVTDIRPDYWVTFQPGTPPGYWGFDSSVRDSQILTTTYSIVMSTDDLIVYARN